MSDPAGFRLTVHLLENQVRVPKLRVELRTEG
jgi:hypothetical protein